MYIKTIATMILIINTIKICDVNRLLVAKISTPDKK